jgi:type II secretory pathway pseudopilin PulG
MATLPVSSIFQKGQALLVVLLVMSVVLTVVLSSTSRSITEVSVSEVEEDSQRAFSAAEAGVEQVLLNQQAISGGTVGSGNSLANFDATYDDALPSPSDPMEFVYPTTLSSGETASFWLVGHDSSGKLTCAGNSCRSANIIEVCYGNPGTPPNSSETPAVVVSVVHDYDYALGNFPFGINASPQNFSKFTSAIKTIDVHAARRASNNFDLGIVAACDSGGDGKIAGQDFAFTSGQILLTPVGLNIPFTCWNGSGCLIMVKVKMLYNDSGISHKIGFRANLTAGGVSLPAQGKLIQSTGTSGTASRQVNVFKSYPEPADVFNNALFVQGSITHN